ncbi:carbonic anhydrase [Azospirillum sp. TSO22-1]|uniref:carbonic anhydrase n=1 Tax=Azospirillum sp. TSO22-1 TaxID=716789 RepID=UPI000D606BE6|nr:carbonic anhydrase [Azospirillum sp. TSO22-1]PWC35571.1 carbonic anhydrase [Azospirillum sp. TSO22-1]
MQTLIDGFRTFRATAFQNHKERYRHLSVAGQNPRAAVIACCDSRVDPQLIFGAGPGDLFVIRNVANLVPPYAPSADYHGTSAALEFAIRQLSVPQVIVMGHTRCGGIRTLLDRGADGGDFIGPWMSIAADVRARVLDGAAHPEQACAAAEREVIRQSLANLMSFPWIREKVETGTLALHGCLFDVAAADLLLHDPASGAFRSMAAETERRPPAACG